MIGYLCIQIGCEESGQITDVSNSQSSLVEYPCLSSEDDCVNSMDISGGTFQFFSSFARSFAATRRRTGPILHT